MSEIYEPAEDSHLLSSAIKNNLTNKNIKVLDMGSGSGVQAKTLIDAGINPKDITLVDINPKSIRPLKEIFSKSLVINSDLFSKVKGKYDLIVFNPPYLPVDKHDNKKDTTGGKNGDETILRFLKNFPKHLNDRGKVFLLLSSLTPMPKIKKIFKQYDVCLLATKKLFYEELFVYEICQKYSEARQR